MMQRKCGSITANYYDENEQIPDGYPGDIQCVFVDSSSDDDERLYLLRERGFEFHERSILTIIEMRKLPDYISRFVRYEVAEQNGITEYLKEIAIKSYPMDRRFHLGRMYDEEEAQKVIGEYLEELSNQDLTIYGCRHHGRLVGYTVLKEHSDETFENLLGAVDAEYQSRGAAMSLYAGMLLSMKERAFKEYRGWISTKNTASLNLHTALGGKFSVTKDRYVKYLKGFRECAQKNGKYCKGA